MALQVTSHGSCCGAKVIDGFWDKLAKKQSYLDSEYPEAEATRMAARFEDRETMLGQLRNAIAQYSTSTGVFVVILNQSQQKVWHDDLVRFGFILTYSDISNPNHWSNQDSRLFHYLRPHRPFAHEYPEELRTAAGLGPSPGVPEVPAPPPPPPVVVPVIQRATTLNYGRPL